MQTNFGGLGCAVCPETEKLSAAVVLCHGFGAGGDDLVGLHRELLMLAPGLANTRFIFPAAPLSLPGMPGARAWWEIDFGVLQAAASGDAEALKAVSEQEPSGMPRARAMLLKAVDEISVQTGLPLGRVIVGGFSQGAMITTDLALRLPEAPLGLAVLSGTLIVREVWKAKAPARLGLPVFQSHGRGDPVLPFARAESLRELLETAGLKVDFTAFDGGHQIPLGVLRKLSVYLASRVNS